MIKPLRFLLRYRICFFKRSLQTASKTIPTSKTNPRGFGFRVLGLCQNNYPLLGLINLNIYLSINALLNCFPYSVNTDNLLLAYNLSYHTHWNKSIFKHPVKLSTSLSSFLTFLILLLAATLALKYPLICQPWNVLFYIKWTLCLLCFVRLVCASLDLELNFWVRAKTRPIPTLNMWQFDDECWNIP